MKKIALATFFAIGFAVGVYAQAGGPPPPPPGPGHFPGGFRGRAIARQLGIQPWKVVTGAPYSATVTRQITRTLANGTTISRTTTGQVARDSSGRTYEEQQIGGGPFASSQNAPRTIVFISDPVAGYSYVLNAAKNTAIRFPFHGHPANSSSVRPRRRRNNRQNPNETVADLGTQTDPVSGLELQGKRVTRTIPEGAIGNSQAITSTTETWYSPALQIVVRSTRNDPRFGQSAYTVSNIAQGEPNPSLFAVPAGYTVNDARRGRGRRGGPPPEQ